MSDMSERNAQSSAVGAANPGATPRPRFNYSQAAGQQRAASLDSTWRQPRTWLFILLLAVPFFYLYRINLNDLVSVWYTNPSFSQGFVIPFISAFFIVQNWSQLKALPWKRSWAGLAVLVFGVGAQVLFLATGQIIFSHLTLLVVLLGLALFILGWEHMRYLWLPIAYLLFMINPPQSLYVKITGKLQILAAWLGVHILPFFNISATRSATQISVLNHGQWFPLDVAEACSGIRSLTAFLALAIALAYTTTRPMWQKIFLALCAIPVAILCNALRVALTGVFLVTLGPEWARGSTHESLGMLMLIPALFMQLGIAWVLDHIFVDASDDTAPSPSHTGGAL